MVRWTSLSPVYRKRHWEWESVSERILEINLQSFESVVFILNHGIQSRRNVTEAYVIDTYRVIA